MTRYASLPLAIALGFGLCAPVAAQNLFAPRVIINDRAVTEWEVQQRTRFLTLLRAPGDIGKQAIDGLIDDRLRMDSAKQLGIEATDEQVEQGMAEFAGRANLDTEQFVAQLAQGGVERETFRDFVRAGIVWREVVRQRYLARTVISDAEVSRAIESASKTANIRVLLSELILAAPPGQEAQALGAAEEISDRVNSGASFAEFAERYSAAPSAQNGGQLEWLPLSDLPPALQPVFLGLQPGQLTQPMPIPNGVALFQLRALDESAPVQGPTQVEFAQFSLSGDDAASRLAEIRTEVDSCGDLYPVAREISPQALTIQTLPTGQLPGDIAGTLAGMDQNESVIVNRGVSQTLVMLCSRAPVREEPINRDSVRNQLQNQRLQAMSEVYLDQLRDNAIIRQP